MSFINRVALITGAGSGIGAAMALHFGKLGARLCLIDINADNLTKVSEQSEKVTEVLKVVADVSKDEDVKHIINIALKEYNKIDILINCAGIYGPGSARDPDILEKFDKVMGINLRSVVAVTSSAIPALIESKGCIINICSVTATSLPIPDILPYTLSKAGVYHFTKCIALDLAKDGVRANCISPGLVKTNILLNYGLKESEQQAFFDVVEQSMPMKKIGNPEDIAEMAAFLASDKASCITGSEFVVDCGYLLAPAAADLPQK